MTLYAGETVGLKCRLSDEADGKAATPVPESVTVEVLTDEATPVSLLAAAPMTRIKRQSGTASGGSTTTLADASKAWTVNKWAGKALYITAGVQAGQQRRILSNTATVLTIDVDQVVNGAPAGALPGAPDATSVYEIHDGEYALNWDSPAGRPGEDLKAVYRATKNAPGAYKAAEVTYFRLEEDAI